MTERIYTRDPQGRLEPLDGESFEKEDELQALIAEHTELLDGTQMRPEDPLRWILIAREQGNRRIVRRGGSMGRRPLAC